MRRFSLILILCSFGFTFCTQQQQSANSSKKYFDLQDFFGKEIQKLQKENPAVIKDIAKNDLKESKTIRIRNWTNELALFAGSDINKSAWKDSYDIKASTDHTEYLANDPDLSTRKITIDQSKGRIKHISILNQVDNSLYSSNEELDYYPDSLYQIRKKQHIILIGDNNYFISGRIK